jgi:type 1 glutamine amidotransferase
MFPGRFPPLLAVLFTAALSPLHGGEKMAPTVLLWIGEDEYRTDQTLPAFAKSDLEPLGWNILVSSEPKGRPGEFPRLVELLPKADLIVLSVRRRPLQAEALELLKQHLEKGKPLAGIRTASHAFAPKDPVQPPLTSWPGFDSEVLGGNYQNHFGKGTVTLLEAVADHPTLHGIDFSRMKGTGSLYRNDPLPESSTVLVRGTIPDQPSQPVAWIRFHGAMKARIFYTSLGAPGDFEQAAFRQWFRQSLAWCLGLEAKPD